MVCHRAGQKALQKDLYNIPSLITNYFQRQPDPMDPAQHVTFGTSGHRGCADLGSFNQNHILAITQAIVDVRSLEGTRGPMFVGKDTHALSEPAFCTVIEVLVANNIQVVVQEKGGYTPTPVISHAILNHNLQHDDKADGIVITPSHNPPQDGGIKYNAPHGGPAQAELTSEIERRANAYIAANLAGVKRISWVGGSEHALVCEKDLMQPYVSDLSNVVDLVAIKKAGLRLGADPLGGAGIDYWKAIATHYDLDITLLNDHIDPSFRFMSLDIDGVIRMDCSSPMAMSGLLAHKDKFDLCFGNDPDFDRHGIVTPKGLMNPNHFLAVCIDYLFRHRPLWRSDLSVGKTLVSSAMIDKVVASVGRSLYEVPVGFKWFVDGLYQGKLAFGAEESAGASFVRKNGMPWTTDKDGIVLCLLAAEITAVTGKNPQQYYEELTRTFGAPHYSRLQAPANKEEKELLCTLSAENVTASTLGGYPITAKLTHAPGNNQPIGGLKVTTDFGWFAARPSGTEDIYKIYCESFKDEQHLALIEQQALQIVSDLFKKTKRNER